MAVQACSVGGLPRSTGTLSTPGARAELAVCLNLFQLNWVLIAATLAVFIVGMRLAGFQLRVSSYLLYFGIAGVYGVVGYLNLKSKLRRSPRVYTVLFFIAQILLQLLLLVSIGYLAATANFPMQDTNLLAMDRALGLDFRAYLALVNRPGLIDALAVTYDFHSNATGSDRGCRSTARSLQARCGVLARIWPDVGYHDPHLHAVPSDRRL
ncbi:hypothetical protein [Bradyrhizobium sp. BR 1432]|uniref:hypothetical protein n=1 Tax=Bradyrhizobium sp. BR 1432 TaxID=3447966 RepID=UPI003EE7200E